MKGYRDINVLRALKHLQLHDELYDQQLEKLQAAIEKWQQENIVYKRHWIFWKKQVDPHTAFYNGTHYGYTPEHKLVNEGYLEEGELSLIAFSYYGWEHPLWEDEVEVLRKLLRGIYTIPEENLNTAYNVEVDHDLANFIGHMAELKIKRENGDET